MSDDGRVLQGRYRLIHRLGQGGMGTVWLAEDVLLKRPVALKELAYTRSLGHGREEMVARLIGEAQAAARLRHPGLVTIHDVVQDGEEPWIVMEYLDGHSLGYEIDHNGPLPWQRVAGIGAQVAAAVAYAHRAGIVHRDLKPDNILLLPDRIVVTDFGIARISGDTNLTLSGTVVGTPRFLAPEILSGQPASPASDMWTLGVTLYNAVEGRPPFNGPTLPAVVVAVLQHPPAPVEHAGPLRELIESLLSKDPAKRPDALTVHSALASHISLPREMARGAVSADIPEAVAPSALPPVPLDRHGVGLPAAYPPDEPPEDGLDDVTVTAALPPSVTGVFRGAVLIDPDTISTRTEFAQALLAVRRNAGMTASEVATVIGVPVSTVRGYFSRFRLPAERTRLLQILRACGVPAEDLARWEVALVRIRSQRRQAAGTGQYRGHDASQESSGPFGLDPPDDGDLLFRVYIPKSQLYAEQRREMLRLFRVWLTTVQGRDIRQQDVSTKDGDTVAFYLGSGQLRPALGDDYRDFVSFVEYSAHNPETAMDRLAEIGLDDSTSTELVTDYAMKFHRMEMGLRHARQNRILSLQQTLEGQLLDRGANPQGITAIQSVQIRSLLDQLVPPPDAAPSLPAIAAPELHQPSATRVNMTFNADRIIYTAFNNIQGTANFGPEARQLLDLISQHAGPQAGSLLTALHEVEDAGIPAKERSTARKKLMSFLTDLAKRVPDIGTDLLDAYLKRKLGLPAA